MSYTVTVSGTTFTVGMSSVDYTVTLSQVGQQGAAGPTGISWLGAWALSTGYALRDVVSNNGSSYICIQAHTSSATDEPGVGANTATYWEVLAEKGVDGSGTGTVTSIDVAGGTGLTSSGGPITSSGTITVALDAASQDSLALADSALQSGDNISVLTNNAGYITDVTGDNLSALADVTITTIASGELLKWNGSAWINNTIAEAGLATAAQGALADSALQSSDIGVSVQGYSAILAATTASFTAADETKLDGIETGATADQTGAEIKTSLFAEDDTNNLTDTLLGKLNGIEAGADVTDTANVTAAGALMDSEVANLAEVKAFDPADYATEADVETTTLNAQTGTTYTLALTDRGQTVTMDNASANTVTIPANSSVAFATGSVVTVIQKGAGVTTIAGATGVTVNGVSAGSGDMSAQWQGVALMKIGTDEWIVSGAIGTVT